MKTPLASLLFAFFMWSLASTVALGDVKLPAVISDNMVLQQRTQARIWGKATPGEKVTISVSWSRKSRSAVAAADSTWLVEIKTPAASSRTMSIIVRGENTIEIKNVLIGEVWLCSGQSNMEFPVARDTTSRWKTAMTTVKEELQDADYPEMRFFRVEHQLAPDAPIDDCVGHWEVCTPATAARFSAVGFIFGRKLHKTLEKPVGLIQSTWGGTHAESWMKKEAMQGTYYENLRNEQQEIITEYPAAKERYSIEMEAYKVARALLPDTVLPVPAKPRKLNDNLRVSTLWNGMINPILPYTIQGVIWYQGESNDSRPEAYQMVFTDLIESWRTEWRQGDFPFYFVQIAPYRKQSPLLREKQLKTWQTVPNTGMAVIVDAGDSTDIHPRNKVVPGERLAFWALSQTYGKKIPYMGPVYKSLEINGAVAVLSFDYVGSGLDSHGEPLRGFFVAGNDQIFYPAKAVITGDKVEVSAPEVSAPVAVRYGWDRFFRVNLYNKEGLPATPFRTDDWK